MNGLAGAGIIDGAPTWEPAWFAKESEHDLEFDEGLEDEESLRPKPPSRRPLIWILVLLVVVAGVYWILQPGPSTQPSKEVPTISKPPVSATAPPSPATGIESTIPAPLFYEGQRVVVAPGTDGQSLSKDAAGTKPGPPIKAGEPVTILDGTFIDQRWVYQVRTASGSTGWVPEDKLKRKS